MKNETLIKNNVEFACDLADILLELDGWGAQTVEDENGDESYTEETQERFEQYYSVIFEQLDKEK